MVITIALTTFPVTLFINISDLEPPEIMHEVHVQRQPQNQGIIINQLLDERAPACSVWRRPRGGSSVHLSQSHDCPSLQSPAPRGKGIWKKRGPKSSLQTAGKRQHRPQMHWPLLMSLSRKKCKMRAPGGHQGQCHSGHLHTRQTPGVKAPNHT